MSCTKLSNPSRVMLSMCKRFSFGHKSASSCVEFMSAITRHLCSPNHFLTRPSTSFCDLQVTMSMSHRTGTAMSLSGMSMTSYSPSLYMVVSMVGVCRMLNSSYISLLTKEEVPNVPVTHILICEMCTFSRYTVICGSKTRLLA